ncbi:MAG: hypothetical protein Q8O40_07900 [Chloroflexota bacterium]|nr:hypothetical protein [Chloroflexota bacterium]
MKGWTTRLSLLVMAALLSVVFVGRLAASPAPAEGDKRAIFGIVAEVKPGFLGAGSLTIRPQDPFMSWQYQVEVGVTTTITVPGVQSPGVSDLKVGDSVAILAVEQSGKLSASGVLVRPTRPSYSQHIAGVVVVAQGTTLTVLDTNGNRLTVTAPSSLLGTGPGAVVTLVVRRNSVTGEVVAVAGVNASASLDSLTAALKQAQQDGQTQRIADLKARLQDQANQELAVISKALANAVGFQDTLRAIQVRLQEQRRQTLVGLGLPAPDLWVSGIIKGRDSAFSSITVEPDRGQAGALPAVYLAVDKQTRIELELSAGPGSFSDLGLANHVEVSYSAEDFTASYVKVVRQELTSDRLARLAPLALRGEADGRVALTLPGATPPTLQVRLSTGGTLTLNVTPDTRILFNDAKIPLANLPLNQRVAVQYDTATTNAIEVRAFGEGPGEAFLAGVVSGIVKKAGEITVTPAQGQPIVLKVMGSTAIERDGEKAPIQAIQLGDLVRPVSRFKSANLELVSLLLKGPGVAPIQGVVAGVVAQPDGDGYVTVATSALDLVTLRVTTTAKLTRNGQAVSVQDIKAGDRVSSGDYNASLQEALRLTLVFP